MFHCWLTRTCPCYVYHCWLYQDIFLLSVPPLAVQGHVSVTCPTAGCTRDMFLLSVPPLAVQGHVSVTCTTAGCTRTCLCYVYLLSVQCWRYQDMSLLRVPLLPVPGHVSVKNTTVGCKDMSLVHTPNLAVQRTVSVSCTTARTCLWYMFRW